MATFVAWFYWCELIGSALYDLLSSLPEAEANAMEEGFDCEHRRLFPDCYLD